MKPLHIVWQRLVDSSGQTCNRCGGTYEMLQAALAKLKDVLSPLGIEPLLEIRELNEESFKRAPTESNRIWIEGRSLEEWLGANAGSSQCCSVCADSECRTIEVEGTVFEVVPEELILKAVLVATAEMLAPTAEGRSNQGELDFSSSGCCADSR